MAKLSHKINSGNDSKKNQSSKLNFSLSTKINTQSPQQTSSKNKENTVDRKTNAIKIPTTKTDFLNLLYKNINFKDFGAINQQFINSINSDSSQINEEELTKKTISHLISESVIKQIAEHQNKLNDEISILSAKLDETKQQNEKQKVQIKNLTAQTDDAEEKIYKIEKKYSNVIAIEDLLSEFITSKILTSQTKDISSLLKESYNNGNAKEQNFVLAFLKGFLWVQEAIKKIDDDEKNNIKILHESSKHLMTEIRGLNSVERRPILDKVANLFNSYLSNYQFISPEQSLQIDPAIHNAEGLGGTTIKEGRSFAVIRTETKKTVYFADIVTK